jgi:3-hydroxyacyl-[acyl-carrier-protein] dehydratase
MEDYDVERIMAAIPHRPPFLMIERIEELVLDTRAVGRKAVSIDQPYLQGNIPGRPILPGVLIVEALAQTAAVLAIETFRGRAEEITPYFISINRARFRRPVRPGDSLRLEVTRDHGRGNVWKVGGRALVGNDLVAEATFMATLLDWKTL